MKIGKTTVEVDINVVLRGDKRVMDLLRHQRMELFQVGLITEDEYAWLSGQRGSVERLETYDVLRKERDQFKHAAESAEKRLSDCNLHLDKVLEALELLTACCSSQREGR